MHEIGWSCLPSRSHWRDRGVMALPPCINLVQCRRGYAAITVSVDVLSGRGKSNAEVASITIASIPRSPSNSQSVLPVKCGISATMRHIQLKGFRAPSIAGSQFALTKQVALSPVALIDPGEYVR